MKHQVSYRALALGAGWCIAGLIAAQAGGVVNLLQEPPGPISVGTTFEVQVWVNGPGAPVELLAFGFDVDPDSTLSLATYTGYTIGPGALAGLGLANDVSGMFFPGASDPSVLLATLTFTADAAGSEALVVRGLADNLFLGLFYADMTDPGNPVSSNDDVDAGITVAIVPEPSAAVIVGLGLGGFVLWRRRRRP